MTRKSVFQIGGMTLGIISVMFVFQLINGLFSEEVSSAETVANVQTGTLVVSGVGEVNARPDMASINLGAQAVASSADEAQTDVNKRLNAIRNVLKEYGIKDEQIQTAYFHVYPYEQPSADGKNTVEKKYRAEHVLDVEYREIDRLGELIDAVSKAGANQIDQIRFGLQNPEKAEHEALELAIKKTATKADVMAKSAGKKKGDVLQISDQAAQVNFSYADTANYAMDAVEESRSTSIESGEVNITQRVDVVYRLQ